MGRLKAALLREIEDMEVHTHTHTHTELGRSNFKMKVHSVAQIELFQMVCLTPKLFYGPNVPIPTAMDTYPPHTQELNIEIYTPRNTQAVELYFRGEKMAKVMGSLAGGRPEEGQKVSGVLIKRGFNYHLIDPSDLSSEWVECDCVCMWRGAV